jgi:hypothetical protein
MGENAANNIVSTQTNKAKLKQPALLQK